MFFMVLGHFELFLGHIKGTPWSKFLRTLPNQVYKWTFTRLHNFKWYIQLECGIFMFSYDLSHFGLFLCHIKGAPSSEPLGTLQNWFPISIACHIQSFKWYILLEYDNFMFSYGFGPFWAIFGSYEGSPFFGTSGDPSKLVSQVNRISHTKFQVVYSVRMWNFYVFLWFWVILGHFWVILRVPLL